jgi:hypothetical protein
MMPSTEEASKANGSAHLTADRVVNEIEDAEGEIGPHLLGFLQSERGHQLASRGLDLLEGLKKATLDEQAKSKLLEGEIKKLNLIQTWRLKTIGIVVVIGAIVGLSATGTLRGEASTILGAVAGYLFAQKSRSDG